MMDKNKYLDKLRDRLDRLPLGELGKVLQKYEKCFEDAGEDREQEVIQELGPYKELAAKIEEEYFSNDDYFLIDILNEKREGISTLRIVVLIFTVYIWAPLIAAAYIFTTSLIIIGLALVFFGLFIIVVGIMALFSSVPTGIFFVGTGFVLIALGILMFIAGLVLIKLVGKVIAFIFGKNKRGECDE